MSETMERPGAGATSTNGKAFFTASDLHAYYGESYIVQGVSFQVNEGEILALLGRNGAGKTSTLRTIAAPRPAGPEARRDLARRPAAPHHAGL